MYLARFEGGGGAWVQTLVELSPPAAAVPPAIATEIERTLARLAGLLAGLQDVHVGFRAVIDAAGRVERQVRLFGPKEKEDLLRRAVGSFLALERLDGGACTLPLDRSQYEALVERFPSSGAVVALPRQQAAGGAWFTAGFRLAPALPTLIEEASGLGLGFAYQAQISPWRADPESIRRARYNLLDLRQLPNLPPGLLSEQERVVAAYQGATRLVREVVAADDAAAQGWLTGAVGNLYRRGFAASQIGGPELVYGTLGDLDLSIHPLVAEQALPAENLDEICREAADDTIFTELFGWTPPATAAAGPSRAGNGGEDGPPGAGDLPMPRDPAGPYLFLSYAHKDVGQIVPMLAEIESAGVACWYDKHLVGGVEWDAELEERIRRSRLLLACISPTAIESKYCRREIKFADALDLPILAVVVSKAELRHGMAMLLQQYQMLDSTTAGFLPQLKQALAAIFGSSSVVATQ